MEIDQLVQNYVVTREGFAVRLRAVAHDLDQWMTKHTQVSPSLTDVAQFEGLRAERSRLLSEFTEAEDSFVVEMLKCLGNQR